MPLEGILQNQDGVISVTASAVRLVLVERASMPGRTVIQWDKEDCSDMGIIKVDLLELGLAILHSASRSRDSPG